MIETLEAKKVDLKSPGTIVGSQTVRLCFLWIEPTFGKEPVKAMVNRMSGPERLAMIELFSVLKILTCGIRHSSLTSSAAALELSESTVLECSSSVALRPIKTLAHVLMSAATCSSAR